MTPNTPITAPNERELWELIDNYAGAAGADRHVRPNEPERVRLATALSALDQRLRATEAELLEARRDSERAEALIRRMAAHPHQAYDHPLNGGGQYGIGLADGHRCAANDAIAFVAALDARASTPKPEEKNP